MPAQAVILRLGSGVVFLRIRGSVVELTPGEALQVADSIRALARQALVIEDHHAAVALINQGKLPSRP